MTSTSSLSKTCSTPPTRITSISSWHSSSVGSWAPWSSSSGDVVDETGREGGAESTGLHWSPGRRSPSHSAPTRRGLRPRSASRPTDDEVTGPEEGDRDQGKEEGHGLGRKGERE